jgi:Protein of unknown function (DUF3309)
VKRGGGILTLNHGRRDCSLSKGSRLGGRGAVDSYELLPRQGETTSRHMIRTYVILSLVFLLIGTLPAWPYSKTWGYYPCSMLVALLSIVLILTLSGRL